MSDIENTQEICQDPWRQRAILAMVELYEVLGYTAIKARWYGFTSPAIIEGNQENHRPDLTCRQFDDKGTPVILEAVGPFEVRAKNSAKRWTLLHSAAAMYDAELQFVVPSWTVEGFPTVEQRLRQRLANLDITPRKVWAL